MIHIKKILYPTDFSSYSNQAYFHAVALAENHGASLTVLFVHTPDFTAPDRPQDATAAQRFWQSQLEQIRPLNPERLGRFADPPLMLLEDVADVLTFEPCARLTQRPAVREHHGPSIEPHVREHILQADPLASG